MRPSRTAPRRSESLSTPITVRPRSANDSASGSPTRPRPTTATSAVLCEGFMEDRRLAAADNVADVLAQEADHEKRVVAGVAPPQPAGLAREAVGPLEAVALHPGGRLGDETGMKVEGCADADEQGGCEAGAHAQ